MIKNETAYQMNELLVIRSAYAKWRVEREYVTKGSSLK